APGIGIGQEEMLELSKSIGAFVVEGLALFFQRIGQGDQRKVDSTIVSCVLALGKQPVLFHAGFGYFLGVFIGDALAPLLIVLGVGFLPPVTQAAVAVKLASLIVKAVSDFVPDHTAFGTVIRGIALVFIEQRRLQDPRGKVDGVGLRVVVCVNCGRSHLPFLTIQRLTDLDELAIEFKGGCPLNVL